jgi:hypothetical protein
LVVGYPGAGKSCRDAIGAAHSIQDKVITE